MSGDLNLCGRVRIVGIAGGLRCKTFQERVVHQDSMQCRIIRLDRTAIGDGVGLLLFSRAYDQLHVHRCLLEDNAI